MIDSFIIIMASSLGITYEVMFYKRIQEILKSRKEAK